MLLKNYHLDPKILHVGTEKDRAYYLPLDPNGKERRILLSGNWRFRYHDCAYDVQEGFISPDFDAETFDVVEVPGCWQMQGYDRNQYTNVNYPFPFAPPYVPAENPCGAYI